MTDNGKWEQFNQAGSGAKPESTDSPTREDAQQAVDNANNCSKAHAEANRLADRSHK